MRHNDVIHLIKETVEFDEWKNPIPIKEKRLVYANRYDVSMSEFYNISASQNASVDDLRDTRAFQIYSFEYENERYFEFGEKEYKVLRVSTKGDKTIIVGLVVLGNEN